MPVARVMQEQLPHLLGVNEDFKHRLTANDGGAVNPNQTNYAADCS